MLRVKDVAEQLGVTERTVRRWLVEEGLPHSKFRSKIQIDPKELEEWKNKQTESRGDK